MYGSPLIFYYPSALQDAMVFTEDPNHTSLNNIELKRKKPTNVYEEVVKC